MVIEIKLPEEGTFARELVITSLLGFGEIGLKIEGRIAYVNQEQTFKEKLLRAITEINSQGISNKKKKKSKDENDDDEEESNVVSRIIGVSSRNYKNIVDLASNIFQKPELFFEKDEKDYFLPTLFPEVMEAEKWYGGWKGTGKGEKRTLGVSRQSYILSIIALYKYEMVSYVEKRENYSALALVDSTIMSDACLPISERIQNIKSFNNLSHIARLLILTSRLSENGCQEIVILKKGKHRAEIYEKNPHMSIMPLIEFWRNINKDSVYPVFVTIMNKDPSMFNSIANYIFEGIRGSLTPDEVTFMIARETYLKDENVTIYPYIMQQIKYAIEAVTIPEAYSK